MNNDNNKSKKDIEKAKSKELEKSKNKSYERTLGILTGLSLVGIGVGYIGNITGLWSGFTMFFPGWWSLFVIVPCLAGVLEYGIATAYTAGLAFGAIMLVTRTGLLAFGWKLVIPAALIYGGLRMVFHNNPFGFRRIYNTDEGRSYFIPVYRSIFIKKDIKITEGFAGAEITSWFKPITADLTQANIKDEAVIYVKAMFAPVTILINPDVNLRAVKISGSGKLNIEAVNYSDIMNIPTLYINATCISNNITVKN